MAKDAEDTLKVNENRGVRSKKWKEERKIEDTIIEDLKKNSHKKMMSKRLKKFSEGDKIWTADKDANKDDSNV